MKRHVFDGIDEVEAFTFGEAGVGRGEDLELLGPLLQKRQPERLAEGAVQVHERRPLTAVVHLDLLPRDIDHLLRAAAREHDPGAVGQLLEGVEHREAPMLPYAIRSSAGSVRFSTGQTRSKLEIAANAGQTMIYSLLRG